MRFFQFISLTLFSAFLLGSCASISHISDDDVYVMKNPTLSSTEEVNNETSFENYRFRRDRRDFNTTFRFGTTFMHPQYIILLSNGGFGAYSAFNDPHYYNPYIFMPYNYYGFQFGNYDTYYNPYFGNSVYYNYSNGYTNNNYNNYNNTIFTSQNKHFGPRNSISGTNNYSRGYIPGKKSITTSSSVNSVRNNGSNFNSKGVSRNTLGSNTSVRNVLESGSVKSSRVVKAGTGLSSDSRNISTNSTIRNSSGTRADNNSSSTRSTSSNSTYRNQESRSTTPKSNVGGSSSGRSGGVSTGGSVGGTRRGGK